MTETDLHPEQHLARVRSGVATPEEVRKVSEHLQHCMVCRAEQALMDQVALDTARVSSLGDVSQRIQKRVLEGNNSATWRPAVLPGRRLRTVALAAAMMLGSGAAAAWVAVRVVRELDAGQERVVEVAKPAPTTRARPIRQPSIAKSEEPVVGEPEPKAAPTQTPTRPARQALKPQAERLSAQQQYTLANSARRSGNVQDAVRRYQQLQRQFPGSPEAQASRVSLGRLLLDRMGNASAALAQFQRYLQHGGALRHEAMVGKARALGRLGRSKEERTAWQSLLRSYPQSTYAARARERIAELTTQ